MLRFKDVSSCTRVIISFSPTSFVKAASLVSAVNWVPLSFPVIRHSGPREHLPPFPAMWWKELLLLKVRCSLVPVRCVHPPAPRIQALLSLPSGSAPGNLPGSLLSRTPQQSPPAWLVWHLNAGRPRKTSPTQRLGRPGLCPTALIY